MTRLIYREVQPESWEEAKEQLQSLATIWVFRGHRDSTWKLKTSLERITKGILPRVDEEILIREFSRRAHHYLDAITLPTNILEWLALMQHHGAPTRLMDWTHSPYVATFFAVDEAIDKKGSCAVWAINKSWCRTQAVLRIRATLKRYDKLDMQQDFGDPEFFAEVFFRTPVAMVAPVEPYRINRRMTIQQGIFMVPGDVSKSFEDNLMSYNPKDFQRKVMKIIIPNEWREEILVDLNHMNINSATLFPGLDGFARSLRNIIHILSDDTHIRKQVEKKMKHGFDLA